MCMFLVFAWCKIRLVGDPGELRDRVRFFGFGYAACLTMLTTELQFIETALIRNNVCSLQLILFLTHCSKSAPPFQTTLRYPKLYLNKGVTNVV